MPQDDRFQMLRLILFILTSQFYLFSVSSFAASSATPRTIVFIGDSITDGYGVKKEEAYPTKVGEILKSKGFDVNIVNGGTSGSVTAEADRRVKWFLRAKPEIVVLALGGNDGLKGTPVDVIEANLDRAIDLAQKNGIKVLLVGQRVYTNLGSDYTKAFEKVFAKLAEKRKVAFEPFLLEGVAMKRELNQSDMKHPNAAGHEKIAERIARDLEKLL